MATDTDSALQQAMNTGDDSTSGSTQPASASAAPQDASSSSSSDEGSNLQALASPAPDASQLPPTSGTLAQTFGAASAPNVFAPSQAPLKGLGGRLRGVLYGLATGNVPGMISGAIDPNDARARYQQRQTIRQAQADTAQATAASAVQNVQFESVRAADSHIQASKQAERIDQLNEESRATVRQMADQHEKFLMDEFGIMPDLSIEGNGQEVHDQATGGLSTLAKENGGTIPPVFANVQPHTASQTKFKIGVYAPSLQDLQKHSAGYRELYDTWRMVQGLPPIDALSWNSGNGNGFRGQRQMALEAMQGLAPVQHFTEQSLPADLASRKQMLAAYEQHTDASGNPDADPAVVKHLQASVDFLQNAYDDMTAMKTKQAADQRAAEAKAALPYELTRAKAEESLRDGDPGSAGQLLVDGDVAPSQIISSRRPSFAQQAFSAAKKIDPNWNAQSAEGYFKTAGSSQNVQFFGSAKSLTDDGGTLDQLQTAYNKLPNGQLPAFNKISDWTAAAAGSGATAGFAQTAIGVADDYAKVMGGGQGSDTSRDQVLKSFAMAHSPAQMKAAIAAAREAVDSQMRSRIGKNPVMNRMYGDQLLIHVTDPKGGDHVFRNQAQADAFKKAAGIS